MKSNITKIADVAFNEKEKLGIVPNEGNDVLWAPEKGIIDNFFVKSSAAEEDFYWWTSTECSSADNAYWFRYIYEPSLITNTAGIRFCVYINLTSIDSITENDDGSLSLNFIEPHVHKWVGKLGETDNVLTAVCEGKGN